MRIVETPDQAPGLCCVSADSVGPFVDTGAKINCDRVGINPHIYLHVPIAEQIGRTVGMVPEVTLRSAEAEIDSLRDHVQELEAELDRANLALEAVDTLKNRGFEQKRGPGRPRKPRHESVAA